MKVWIFLFNFEVFPHPSVALPGEEPVPCWPRPLVQTLCGLLIFLSSGPQTSSNPGGPNSSHKVSSHFLGQSHPATHNASTPKGGKQSTNFPDVQSHPAHLWSIWLTSGLSCLTSSPRTLHPLSFRWKHTVSCWCLLLTQKESLGNKKHYLPSDPSAQEGNWAQCGLKPSVLSMPISQESKRWRLLNWNVLD